jgi:uncharacterized protein (TIGR02453 family)
MAQLDPVLITFLKALKTNNNREWFIDHKKQYELAKTNFTGFVEELISGIKKMDRSIGDLTAKECMFRINRDIRFAADKSPYKTNMGAGISKGGKKLVSAGYYIHIEPGGSFIAGGVHMPPPEVLHAIRQEIDYHTAEFKTLVYNKNFVGQFKKLDESDKLKTAPKGYAKDHAEIETLKLKSFIVTKKFSDKEICSPGFLEQSLLGFTTIKPLNDFLNRATA